MTYNHRQDYQGTNLCHQVIIRSATTMAATGRNIKRKMPQTGTGLVVLLPDTCNCGLRMCRECRERFPHHRVQRKPLVSDPGMHHGTCITHLPWCMSGYASRNLHVGYLRFYPQITACHGITYKQNDLSNINSNNVGLFRMWCFGIHF